MPTRMNPDGSIASDWDMNVTGSKAQDLKMVVEGLNMAAGASVNSSYIDNAEWVRNIVFLAQSDQQYNLIISRRDHDLISDWGDTFATNLPATTTAWNPIVYQKPLGYSARFGIKNSAAVANTFARLRAQLLGM